MVSAAAVTWILCVLCHAAVVHAQSQVANTLVMMPTPVAACYHSNKPTVPERFIVPVQKLNPDGLPALQQSAPAFEPIQIVPPAGKQQQRQQQQQGGKRPMLAMQDNGRIHTLALPHTQLPRPQASSSSVHAVGLDALGQAKTVALPMTAAEAMPTAVAAGSGMLNKAAAVCRGPVSFDPALLIKLPDGRSVPSCRNVPEGKKNHAAEYKDV